MAVLKKLSVVLIFLAVFTLTEIRVFASSQANTKYILGSDALVNTGKDNGFSGNDPIMKGDPHLGWSIGEFYVEGFTSVIAEGDYKKCPVFLKNVGDTVALKFELRQDINKLHGDENIKITDDVGYDTYFGIEETKFGHGVLIIRYTDYQNNKTEPQIYTDYFNGKNEGWNTSVKLCEEGDYEVALDYEIQRPGFIGIPEYFNYRIFFKFSVRNSNCMVFARDVITGEELKNTSMTENGFMLDLANSRYLDINVKKRVWNEGTFGLAEDTRFNRAAKAGEKFTEEGMYAITVKNRYTKEETTTEIYVGKNNIISAHFSTGYSFVEIKELIDKGAIIYEDGTIEMPAETTVSDEITELVSSITTNEETKEEIADAVPVMSDNIGDNSSTMPFPVIISIIIAVIAVIVIVLLIIKRKKSSFDTSGEDK